jgi:hypothetical protein
VAYEERRLARQKVRYDNANDDLPLVYQLVDDGAKTTPTSATITIYAPGSDTALVDAAAMTVSGTLLTYVLSTTTEADWPVQAGYRADVVVTAGSVTHERHFLFDVAARVFVPNVSFDQLVALDDGIRGQLHDGSESMASLIEACRDELQVMIESRVRDFGNRLREEQILDASRMSIPFRRYVLWQFWDNKGDTDRSAKHEERFKSLYDAVMASLSLDEDQDGSESSEVGEIPQVVFER